jgi:hypothetical protein
VLSLITVVPNLNTRACGSVPFQTNYFGISPTCFSVTLLDVVSILFVPWVGRPGLSPPPPPCEHAVTLLNVLTENEGGEMLKWIQTREVK